MYLNGCLYSGLCVAHSALPRVITIQGCSEWSENPFVSSDLKGIYKTHPPLPRYMGIRDINLFIRYYDSKDDNENLEFKNLVENTVMLFVVVGAPRKQSLFTISGSQKKTGSHNRQNKTYDVPGSKGTYFVCIFRKFFK